MDMELMIAHFRAKWGLPRDVTEEVFSYGMRAAMPVWRTIDSCPNKESVLFFCGEFMQVGMMEHSVMRVGGDKRDCFWGWFGADENPPTHWMPLPETPNAEVRGDAPLYGAASLSTDGLERGG